MNSYQDLQAVIAPKGYMDEYKAIIATLPRHSFREDGKIPRFDSEFADGKSQLTCDVRFSMYDDEDTNANPEISFKTEDFIRKRLGKWEGKSNFSLEFNLVSDLSNAIGFQYGQKDIESALEKILNTNLRIKCLESENYQKSIAEDLFCLVGGYEMYGVEYEDAEEETYVKANITPVYADILRNSDLDPFERRMLENFPAISRRWYEVIRLWRSYRSKTRSDISIKYSELCDWMPIDRMGCAESAMEQISKIHSSFIECKFIKDFEIKTEMRKKSIDLLYKYRL